MKDDKNIELRAWLQHVTEVTELSPTQVEQQIPKDQV